MTTIDTTGAGRIAGFRPSPPPPPAGDSTASLLGMRTDDLGVEPQELLQLLEQGLGKDLGQGYGEQKVSSGVRGDTYA